MRNHVLAAAALLVVWAGGTQAAPPPNAVRPPGKHAEDTCTACHMGLDEARLRTPAQLTDSDIHHTQGITCAGCHGGDPTSEDATIAMSPTRGFVGKFTHQAIPDMCGSCHSDAAFMLRYAPNIPTDQLQQYRTSKHGLALAKGDTNVAVCSSCHGAHGVRQVSDGRSPVYPTHIVDTCGRCHSNRSLMTPYGIKGDEVEEYKRSVHYASLTKKNDLSAPTCKSCHGAHGATPPGVSSVSNVCGTCHPTQRERFDLSPHKDAFAALQQPACESCHSNHEIVHPTDTWIGVGEKQVCGSCHSAGDAGADAALAISSALASATNAIASAQLRVGRVQRAGMLMDDADVKLEDAHQALVLAQVEIHTVNPARVEGQTRAVLGGTGAAEKLAAAAEAEIRYRRTGLFISLAVIALAMVALILKVRSMER
ncbi:MAG TPA: multiheme c-type cytochrome [Thermoanaerobaculaceae bacterium]|nr:multiheme c-type cytochrome [Thermoanaerobaculaceae bacterium]